MMRFLKSTLTVAILATSTQISAAEVFNAKTFAMSGAGLAVSDFSYGTSLNPALGSNYDSTDDFNFNVNVGVLASDQDELLTKSEDIVDILDRLDGKTLSQSDEATITDLDNRLKQIDGTTATIDAGGSVEFSIPNKYLATTLFIRSNLALGVTTLYKSLDSEYFDNLDLANTPEFNADDLETSVRAQGAAVVDVGLNFSTAFNIAGQKVNFGLAPKYQIVKTIDYQENIADFEEDDFDADNHTVEDENFNIDLGVQTSFGNWSIGAVLKNALENEYTIKQPVTQIGANSTLTIEPQFALGVGYKNSWIQASLDLDANAIEDYISAKNVQFARFGAELNAWDQAAIRVGYRHDLEGTYEDTISAGIGISPFDFINIDIAALYGDNDTVGGAVQLGMSF